MPNGNGAIKPRLTALNRALLKFSPALHLSLAVGALLLVSAVDFYIKQRIGLSLSYLFPIAYATWYWGKKWGYALSLLSAGLWLSAELGDHNAYSKTLIPYWNAFIRLGYFTIVTFMTTAISRLRKLIEFERAAEEKANATSELKSNMLSFVSHEIGNNLATLKLVSVLLQESEPSDISDRRRQMYEMTDRVIAHLNAAVSNFLNLDRLSSGNFKLEIRRTPIRSLIHNTISILEPLIENKNIHLKLDLPSFPVPVRADSEALALILSNLIGNAFKYTPAGGSVTVRVLTEESDSEEVLVSIEDTGIGISPEDLGKLPSGYFRSTRGKEVAKGFGVGLKVAHDLLAQHGSELHIESVVGQGSLFSFRIPRWTVEKKSLAPAA